MSQDSSVPNISEMSTSEGCVVIMIIITLFISLTLMGTDPFPFIVALGLSSIALAILHLARSIQASEK
ncbi:MAG: hypothetical protein ACFFEE_07875 [Candidatus Thorarchaeota archaeon]